MTGRERWLQTLLFGEPDRVPFQPGWPRESTRARWLEEGLPEEEDWFGHLCREIGLDPSGFVRRGGPGVNFRMMPTFEEKILEHRDGHYVVQDWKGNICEIDDRFDTRYLRHAIDFVTRKWIKLPVENREDWERMKERYDPEEPGRIPEDLEERCRKLREDEAVVVLRFSGPFWQMREWVGFEGLCMLFADDPDFVRDMVKFWTGFVSRVMAPVLQQGVVDHVMWSEDMAYKQKCMISPAMVRRFLQPTYERWSRECREAGVQVVDIDSDGKIDELIPIWIDSGVNCCNPIERAAGNDPVEMRERFGDRMAFRGGVDKRCIARGGKAIEEELAHLEPVVRQGGYIPTCDHGVPADVSWPDFVRYSRRLAEVTGWL